MLGTGQCGTPQKSCSCCLVKLNSDCLLTSVPCDIVAPALGLYPMYGPCVDPHKVLGTLEEAVEWDIFFMEVFYQRPPRS